MEIVVTAGCYLLLRANSGVAANENIINLSAKGQSKELCTQHIPKIFFSFDGISHWQARLICAYIIVNQSLFLQEVYNFKIFTEVGTHYTLLLVFICFKYFDNIFKWVLYSRTWSL